MQRLYIVVLAVIVIVVGMYLYQTKLHHGFSPSQLFQRLEHNFVHLRMAVYMVPIPWTDQLTCDEVKNTIRPYVPEDKQAQLDALSEPECTEGIPKITKWQLRMFARKAEFFSE